MKNVKLVIFDLDGTLLDTGEGILKCIASTLKKMGLLIPNEGACRSFVGPPLKKRFLELFDTGEETADEFVRIFREEYSKGDMFLARIYDGVVESLTSLHQCCSLAVATNKREDYAVKILEKFGIAIFFDAISGSDCFGTQSKEQIVANAARQVGALCEECLMVGDSDNDAIASARLGIRFVGVTYGYGFKKDDEVRLFPHIGVLNSPLEIVEIVKNIV